MASRGKKAKTQPVFAASRLRGMGALQPSESVEHVGCLDQAFDRRNRKQFIDESPCWAAAWQSSFRVAAVDWVHHGCPACEACGGSGIEISHKEGLSQDVAAMAMVLQHVGV